MARNEASHFIEEGTSVVLGVRRALSDLLAEVGASAENPRELSRRFGLDKMLTWHVACVVTEEDAWAAVAHIPRRPSAKLLTAALSRHGASKARLGALHEALESFERFVEAHSGDRETLEVMAGIAADGPGTKRLAMFQKRAFQANCAIWGVSASVHVVMNLLAPSREKPGMVDLAVLGGFVGFRRLRPNLRWAVASLEQWDSSHRAERSPVMALAPELAEGGIPLLGRFCTRDMPELERVEAPDGSVRFEVTRGRVGNAGAADIMLGWKWPATGSAYQSVPGERAEVGRHLNMPVESAVLDLFVHRDLVSPEPPRMSVFSDLPGGPLYTAEPTGALKLPVVCEVTSLGAHPPHATTPDVPNYGEMFEFAAARMGLSPEDFRGYRCRLSYPPVPSLAIFHHPLLPRPAR